MLLTDNLELKANAKAKLLQIVEEIDFPGLWKTSQETARFVLSTVAAQNMWLPAELQQKIKDWLIWAVKRLVKMYPTQLDRRMIDNEKQTHLTLKIFDIAAWLSIIPYDPMASSRIWNKLIEQLGNSWPNLFVWLEPFLFRCWIELPVEQIQGLGKKFIVSKGK